MTTETTGSLKPELGDLLILSGPCLGVALQQDHAEFIKVVTVEKNEKRRVSYYLPEALCGPDSQRLASLVQFYDKCAGFYDGSAGSDDGSEIGALIANVRDEAFELIRATATAVDKFDAPTNYSRARVALDFAERSGAEVAQLAACEAALVTAKEASRAQFDVAGYYTKLQEAGYEPTITGFGGRIAIGGGVSGNGEYPPEADEIDIDCELRWDYALSMWERRVPGTLVVHLGA